MNCAGRTFRTGTREIARERIFTGLLLVAVPLPFLACAVALAAGGETGYSWLFLACSLAADVVTGAERSLVVRGLAALSIDARASGVSVKRAGGENFVGTLPEIRLEILAGIPFGRPFGAAIAGKERVLLPWTGAVREFVSWVEEGGGRVARRVIMPWKGACFALAAAGAVVSGFVLLLPWGATSALILLGAAAVLHSLSLVPLLGPGFARLDRFLSLALPVLAAAAAVFSFAANPPSPEDFRLPGVAESGLERSESIIALGEAGMPGLRMLLSLARSGEASDRRDAALALYGWRGKDVTAALDECARDADASVRMASVHSMGALRSAELIEILIYAVEKDPDQGVATEANRALERLTDGKLPAAFDISSDSPAGRKTAADFWRRLTAAPSNGKGR